MHYHEIEKLKQYFELHEITISKDSEIIREDLFFVNITIDSQDFKILVDDECRDFSTDNPLMNWFLILLALETYDESEDILE